MTDSPADQATITDRIDAAMAALVAQGEAPRALYLTPDDYETFAAEYTDYWRTRLGSTALFWPVSHADVPIIAEHLIEKVEIPVRQWVNLDRRRSALYSATGRCVLLEVAREL